MNFDQPGSTAKVRRKLDRVRRGDREAWRLTAIRVYDTEIADAWDALTNPERIPRWFLPISGDLELGGRYQFKGNAGGMIERCEPPRLLAITWEMHGDVSWVTVQLEAQGNSTQLTLEHIAHVPDAIFDQFGPGGVGVGWDLGLMGLGLHFETRESVDAAEAQKWVLASEGHAFVEASSNAWAEASIAAGTPGNKASEAASRVVEFYSPQPAKG